MQKLCRTMQNRRKTNAEPTQNHVELMQNQCELMQNLCNIITKSMQNWFNDNSDLENDYGKPTNRIFNIHVNVQIAIYIAHDPRKDCVLRSQSELTHTVNYSKENIASSHSSHNGFGENVHRRSAQSNQNISLVSSNVTLKISLGFASLKGMSLKLSKVCCCESVRIARIKGNRS